MRRKQFSSGLEDEMDKKYSNFLNPDHLETLKSVVDILDRCVQLDGRIEGKLQSQIMSKFPYNVLTIDLEKKSLVQSINMKISLIQVKSEGNTDRKVINFLSSVCDNQEEVTAHAKELSQDFITHPCH